MEAGSILEQYRIADFLEWHRSKQLKLNPYFQRRSVWTPQAKVYLVDTILRGMPIPKIYMRTQIDASSLRSFREVVDGQQRLRAITEFAGDGFRLTRRAKEFAGLTFTTLGPELQEAFLTYAIAVDQLVNASDDDVLEVFARLNTYTVSLSPAERRHAKYQGNFKWAVHEAAQSWRAVWEDLAVIAVRDRLRMADDALMAEMFGILLNGVTDGGAANIERLYSEHDDEFPEEDEIRARLDAALGLAVRNLSDTIPATPLARGPQFLMLFGAIAHASSGIPAGQIGADMPAGPVAEIEWEQARQSLDTMASALEQDPPPRKHRAFWQASKGSTQRISTRRVRFLTYYEALTGVVDQ